MFCLSIYSAYQKVSVATSCGPSWKAFETLSAIIILTPIFLPVVKMYGVNPIHFGIILVCGLAIGFVTPPLGTTLFLGAQLADTTLERTLKYLLPYLLMMICTLLLLTFVPDLSMFLVRLLSTK